MITINNTTYTTSPIVLTDQNLNDVLEISSDSVSIVWTLREVPSLDNQAIIFYSANGTQSTFNSERIDLGIIGSYYLTAVERDINGNYVESKIYFRVNDLELGNSLPFSTEKKEISSTGWAQELQRYILDLKALVKEAFRATSIDGGQANDYDILFTYDGGNALTTAFELIVDGGDSTEAEIVSYDGGDAGNIWDNYFDGETASTSTFIYLIDGGDASAVFTTVVDGNNL